MKSSESEMVEMPVAASDARLPYAFARNHGVLIVDDALVCRDHLPPSVIAELCRFVKPLPETVRRVDEDEFRKQLTEFYQRDDSAAQRAADDLDSDEDLSRLADEIPDATDLMEGDNDAPVVRLINATLSQAVREGASDIHIETFEHNVSIRFRIDGVLREVLAPKRQLAPLLISRLKIMAKLDIAEKRIPQDGRISIRIGGHAVDIRLSTIPSAYNERIVLRLLDTDAGRLSVEQMDFGERNKRSFLKALHAPHGVILVTGPTGSGKTTTLYAGLTEINETSRNIMTIEDPVEYMLEGIAQTQVNPKVDMTFARGLRAILRQDPDVVMIGEIRDLETAEIAIRASLTGHLVLSTLHTNNAIGSVTRLRDMGLEPFLLSSSLIALMAQRLVRRLCTNCRQPSEAGAVEKKHLGMSDSKEPVVIYKPSGCEACNQTGYRGRAAIHELIEIDETLREMIHQGADEQKMSEYGQQNQNSLFGDGVRRVLDGQTTLEELLRVTLIGA